MDKLVQNRVLFVCWLLFIIVLNNLIIANGRITHKESLTYTVAGLDYIDHEFDFRYDMVRTSHLSTMRATCKSECHFSLELKDTKNSRISLVELNSLESNIVDIYREYANRDFEGDLFLKIKNLNSDPANIFIDIDYEEGLSTTVFYIVLSSLIIVYFILVNFLGDPRSLFQEDLENYAVVFMATSLLLGTVLILTFLNLVSFTVYPNEFTDSLIFAGFILLFFAVTSIYFGLGGLYTYSRYAAANNGKYALRTVGLVILMTYPLVPSLFADFELIFIIMIFWPVVVSIYLLPSLIIGTAIFGRFSD